MKSLNLLLEITSNERAKQLSHFDALDSKAGLVLGFAGALIALVPEVGGTARALVVWLAGSAAITAAAAFWPRRFPSLDCEALRSHMMAESEFTKLTLHDTYLDMIKEASVVLSQKSRLLKAAMALLALAAATLAISLGTGATT